MATFNNIDGEEPSTVTFRVGTIQIARGSTNEQQEILCLGDPESSDGIARVSSGAPKSTDAALFVRLAGGPSSVADVAIRAVLPSTGADNPVSAVQGSTVWQVQIHGDSTVVQGGTWNLNTLTQCSSLSTGHVTVDTGSISVAFCSSLSTGHVTVDTGSIQISAFAANLALPSVSSLSTGHVTVDTGSIQVSAFAAGYISSATPAAGSSGLNVWTVGGILSSIGGAINSVSSLSTGHVTVDTGSITIASILAGAGRLNIGSTAADNAVTVTPAGGSTFNTRPLQSTASDLRVAAQLFDSTNNAIETSTFAASTKTSTVRGLMVRQAVPDCTSATVRLATAGDNAVLTSAATTIHVYALTFAAALPTTGPSTGSSGVLCQLQAGTTGARLWSFNYQFSSLMTAMQSVAVTPPCYLFRSGAGNSLNAAAGSTGGYVSVAAWRE